MSHYSDCYYKANKNEFERERKAERYRKRMIDELPINTMIRIMFADFLDKKSDALEYSFFISIELFSFIYN